MKVEFVRFAAGDVTRGDVPVVGAAAHFCPSLRQCRSVKTFVDDVDVFL